MPEIVVENVVKTYRRGVDPLRRGVRALDDVSLEIRPGETLGVIGPNGAGKTTLIGCLLGFLHPDSGRITIDGRPPDDLAIRAITGYLPERLVLDRWMRGRDFLRYHHALAGLPAGDRARDTEAVLARVGLDPAAGARRVAEYSRGMLQRLGLAQALLGQPRLLVLDEPISGVDPAGIALFRRILGDLAAQGVTLVVNSHQLDEVERVCSRVVFVKQGRITSMETLRAGEREARVLRIRFAASFTADSERLARLATHAGATLQIAGGSEARFTVADDPGATRLLAALLADGLPVVEAIPETGRLERLFVGTPEATP